MGPISAYKNLKDQAQQQPKGNTGGYWSNDGPRDRGDINIASGIAGGGYYVPGPLSQSQPQQPQIDTSDPINSLAGMLVTPAEREAQQQKLMENKRKMLLWTGLFDGLRNLGNLYSVSKGARPQQYTDNPYKTIEMGYQQEMKNLDDVYKNRQAYAQQLYNWQRQVNEDKRKEKLADAQAQWYGTREELAQQKSELDKLKAVRVIKQKDGSLLKFDPVSGSIEPLSEADPLYVKWMNTQIEGKKAQTKKTLSNMGGGGSGRSGNQGYETIVTEGYDENNNKFRKTVKQPRQSPKSTKSSSDGKGENAGSSDVDPKVLRTFSMRRR